MHLIKRLIQWLGFNTSTRLPQKLNAKSMPAVEEASVTVPFDVNLTDRVKILWMLGALEELACISSGEVVGHPQRGLIAAYIGAAHAQRCADESLAPFWFSQAKAWGCNTARIIEIMLSNVHISIAEMKLRLGDETAATAHIADSLQLSSPGVPQDLLVPGRVDRLRQAQRTGASSPGLADATGLGTVSVSPDIARLLIQMISTRNVVGVLEFGSGPTTYLVAKATLDKARATGGDPAPVRAYEHLSGYAKHSRSLVKAFQSSGHVVVVDAPLVPFTDPSGSEWRYYDCNDDLKRFAEALENKGCDGDLLVVVNGPLVSTGKNAPYPALPFVLHSFKRHRLLILISDCISTDERELVALWEKDLKTQNFDYEKTVYPFKKEATLLTVFRKKID